MSVYYNLCMLNFLNCFFKRLTKKKTHFVQNLQKAIFYEKKKKTLTSFRKRMSHIKKIRLVLSLQYCWIIEVVCTFVLYVTVFFFFVNKLFY